jgi:hypothetical protein
MMALRNVLLDIGVSYENLMVRSGNAQCHVFRERTWNSVNAAGLKGLRRRGAGPDTRGAPFRLQADDRIMDRAFGQPLVAVQVDQTSREMAVRKIEVRWLPPDPNDRSNYIAPEPD